MAKQEMKTTPTTEEIEIAARKVAKRSKLLSDFPHDELSVGYGFKKGAEWMEQQLEPMITEMGMDALKRTPISVTDRLPEYGKKVLCFGHEMAMNPQMGGFYWFICSRIERLKERHQQHLNQHLDENGFKRATVTHWMELPGKPLSNISDTKQNSSI